jgi:hypothetical protein
MQTYHLTFTDGSTGYCEGQSLHDVVAIAEKITGKTVKPGENKWDKTTWESIKKNPYPTGKMIWQLDHPAHGKTPGFCYGGAGCIGRGSCPKNPSCTS